MSRTFRDLLTELMFDPYPPEIEPLPEGKRIWRYQHLLRNIPDYILDMELRDDK